MGQGIQMVHVGFMGSYLWGFKSPNVGYKYSYLRYNPTYNCP